MIVKLSSGGVGGVGGGQEKRWGGGRGVCCVGGGVTEKIFSDGNVKPSAAFWANPVSSSFLFGPRFVFFFCGFFEGRPVVF